MSWIEAEINRASTDPVKRKANNTRKLGSGGGTPRRSKASRIASGSPEVMVKITGFSKGASKALANLEYISRNGKVEIETDRGEILDGRADVREYFNAWNADFGDSRRAGTRRDTMHLILSMPNGCSADDVKVATRHFAENVFGGRNEYVFALHEDTDNPHCHLTVKCRGFDGKQLNPRKDDLQAWRDEFAVQLRKLGVDAEASPRSIRGQVRKAESSVVRHIEQGGEKREPRVPKVKAAQILQTVKDIEAEAEGKAAAPKPWLDAIKAQRGRVVAAWTDSAAELERPPLTINKKEQHNVRPNYDQRPSRERRIQQAVYQSRLAKAGRGPAAGSLAGMRNLSGIAVVQHQRAPEMFLSSDARHRVGRGGRPGDDMRRSGIGPVGAGEGERNGRMTAAAGVGQDRAEQAAVYRAFVANMPNDLTQGEQREAELKAAFTKPRSQVQAQPQGLAKEKGQEQGQEPRQGALPLAAPQSPQGRSSQPGAGEKKGVEPSTPDQGEKKGRSR